MASAMTAFAQDAGYGCQESYSKRARKINDISLVAAGVTVVAAGAAMPVIGGLVVTTGVITTAAGGTSMISDRVLADRATKAHNFIESNVDKISPFKRPAITMPTALPFYQMEEAIAVATDIQGEDDLLELVEMNIILNSKKKELRKCRRTARKAGLYSTDMAKLRKRSIIDFESKMNDEVDASPYRLIMEDAVTCLKGIKANIQDEKVSAYDAMLSIDEGGAVNKSEQRYLDSLGKLVKKVSKTKEGNLNYDVNTIVNEIVAQNDAFGFCQKIKRPLTMKKSAELIRDSLNK